MQSEQTFQSTYFSKICDEVTWSWFNGRLVANNQDGPGPRVKTMVQRAILLIVVMAESGFRGYTFYIKADHAHGEQGACVLRYYAALSPVMSLSNVSLKFPTTLLES